MSAPEQASMKRWIVGAVGVALLAGVGAYALLKKPTTSGDAPAPSVNPASSAAPAASAEQPTPSLLNAPPPPVVAHGFDRLPDGQPVPELPKTAPTAVKFGVVLFEYEGAQGAPGQQAPKTRSKAAALDLAKKAIELAKTDFAAAVAKGDRGSIANAGKVSRRILEPSVEYQLFMLEKGAVAPEPIDTPRGYWVVRRVE